MIMCNELNGLFFPFEPRYEGIKLCYKLQYLKYWDPYMKKENKEAEERDGVFCWQLFNNKL